jgi:hypothetical protein
MSRHARYIGRIEALFHIIDWLVANKTFGIPVASALVLGSTALGWMWRRRTARATFAATAPSGKVQQVNVERLRSKGDINVNSRQE